MNMRAIAAKAGVSSATVSRVINGSALVSEETTRRVKAILDAANVIPNPVATTLKYGRSKTFGLLIPDICNPFYEFLGEFERLLVQIDHEVLLTNIQSDEQLVKSVRRMLMRKVDGAVFMASEFDTQKVEPLLLHKVPLVTVDRRSVQAGCSDVAIDFEGGFLLAVRHLAELGHRRIGFIGGTEGLRTSEVRLEALRSAMESSGLHFDPGLVRAGDYRVAGGEKAIVSLMQSIPRPTAVLTANDMTAFGAVRGLHAMNLRVPFDVSVVGLDDVLLTDVLQPPLTTVRIPRRRMAEACIQALQYTKEDVHRMGKHLQSLPNWWCVKARRESRSQLAEPAAHRYFYRTEFPVCPNRRVPFSRFFSCRSTFSSRSPSACWHGGMAAPQATT